MLLDVTLGVLPRVAGDVGAEVTVNQRYVLFSRSPHSSTFGQFRFVFPELEWF